jgi:hypothetical protein
MHYSLWANDMDTFRGYWLHGNNLGKIHDGWRSDLETTIHFIRISLGCSPKPPYFIINVFIVNVNVSYYE